MGAEGDSDHQTQAPGAPGADGRPPLVLTVGFTGHRELGGHAEAVAARLGETLRVLQKAVAGVEAKPLHEDETLADAFAGKAQLRLVCGEAPGSDRLMIDRWRAAGLGEAHRVYPFRDPATGGALTDHPDFATPETHVRPPADPAAWTGFDSVDLGLSRDHGHLEVAYWLIRTADLLVAVWDGKAIDKTGGTGATLTAALERGVPVIWIRPDAPQVQLIDPEAVHRRGRGPPTLHVFEAAGELTPARLAKLLFTAIAPPGGVRGVRDPEVIARRDYARANPLRRAPGVVGLAQQLMDRTLWRSYAAFERIAGGRKHVPMETWDTPAPPSLQGQPGFLYLNAMYDQAERRASNLGAIHRSQQLLLIVIATLAVLVGALPALLGHHVLAASVELGLGVFALLIVRLAWRAHRHRRWSDARRLAERMRAARATWPLCVDIADADITPAQTWTEWRARALVRAAGPRQGWITRQLVNDEVEWIASNLVEGQRVYHAGLWKAGTRIERGIEAVGNAAFGFLIAILGCYLLAAGIRSLMHLAPPKQDWTDGALLVVSAVSPAIGAACLGLNATLGFSELARRSERMEHEFELLKEQLAPDPTASLPHLQRLVRHGAQLLVEDATGWRDRLAMRRIMLG